MTSPLSEIIVRSVVSTVARLVRATLALRSDDETHEADNVVALPHCFVCDDAGCEFCPTAPHYPCCRLHFTEVCCGCCRKRA